jgi:hypothetical protein
VNSALRRAGVPLDTFNPKQLPGERRIARLCASLGALVSAAFYSAWAFGYWQPRMPEPMFVDTGEPAVDAIVNWGPILLIPVLWLVFYRRLKRRQAGGEPPV